MSISTRKKILLHLPGSKEKAESSSDPIIFEQCQEGISDVMDRSQNRISRLLKEFETEDLVEVKKKRFESCPQSRKVYFLSQKGEKKAREIKNDIKEKTISIKTEDEVSEIKLKDLDRYIKGRNKILFALNNLDKKGLLDLTDIGKDDFFVDRKKEEKKLKERIRKTKEERSHLLLLTGPVGVGKTRLIERIKKYAEDENFSVLRGRCQREATNPLHPFEKALSGIEEDFKIYDLSDRNVEDYEQKDEMDPSPKKEEFFNQVLKDLEVLGEKKPHMIFLDDLQFGDLINLQLLKFLAENLEKTPILFVGTMKREEIEFKKSLELMERCSRLENCFIQELEPFDWRDTRKMITRELGRRSIPDRFIDLCQEVSQGIPLFIKEYIGGMLEESVLDPIEDTYPKSEEEVNTPSKIKDMIENKIDRLNEREREVIELCAMIGDEISLELLISTADAPEKEVLDAKEELELKNLLRRYVEDEVTFFHPIIKTLVEENIPETKKKRIHRKIAENIEKDPVIDIEDNYLELAKHYKRAGELERAVDLYLKAGKKAESVYANDKARELYQRVLDICEDRGFSGLKKPRVIERLAGVEKNIGDLEKSGEYLQEAIESVDKKEDLRRLYRKVGENHREVGDFEKAIEYLEKALSHLPEKTTEMEEKKERCRILREMGMTYLRTHDHERCSDIFDEIKKNCEKIDYKKGKGEALHYLGSIDIFRSDFDRAVERLKKAVEIRKEIEDTEGLMKSYNNLGVIYRNKQEHDEALEHFENANRLKKEMCSGQEDPEALDNIGIVYYDRGDLEKAIDHHERALKIEERMGDKNGIAATLDNIGVVFFEMGKLDEAKDNHKRSLKIKEELGNKNGVSLSHFNLGKCYKEKGRYEKALESFDKSLKINEELECKQDKAYSLMWRGLTYMGKGKSEKAKEDLNQALEMFLQIEDRYGKGISLSYLGKLTMKNGSLDKAKKYLKHSKRIGSDFEDSRYRIINTRFLAELYIKNSEYQKALELIKESISLARYMGAVNQEGKCLMVLGKILSEDDASEEAEEKFKEALELFQEVGNRVFKGKVLYEWGHMLSENGRSSKGRERIEEAEKIFKECGAAGPKPA